MMTHERPYRYPLDNAGKLYPAVATAEWNAVFRLSAQMKETIDADLLQTAADRVLPRFPLIKVKLHPGFFWYTLEENTAPFLVQRDAGVFCLRFRWHEDSGYLLRILYSRQHVSVEFFHALTDGHGAMIFLKTLVAEYLRLRGYSIPSIKGVLDPMQAPPSDELEDMFLRIPLPQKGLPRGSSCAYRFTGMEALSYVVNIASFKMPASVVHEKARACGVTITEYLTAAMLYAAARVQVASGTEERLPVRVSVPVDMRRFFPANTLRNFSFYVNPGVEAAALEASFESILAGTHAYMADTVTVEYLTAGILSNVASERNLIARMTPLPLKNLAIRAVFNATGDRLVTTTLTNMGVVSAPDELLFHVERFEFVLGASSPGPCCNAALITTGDTMTLTFGSNLCSNPFIEEMEQFLSKQDIPTNIDHIGGQRATV